MHSSVLSIQFDQYILDISEYHKSLSIANYNISCKCIYWYKMECQSGIIYFININITILHAQILI